MSDLGNTNLEAAAIIESLRARLEAAEAALREIAEQQPRTLRTLRHHGIVFDGPLGADPENWQHVAFTIYSDLCKVDSIARGALPDAGERSQETGQP